MVLFLNSVIYKKMLPVIIATNDLMNQVDFQVSPFIGQAVRCISVKLFMHHPSSFCEMLIIFAYISFAVLCYTF